MSPKSPTIVARVLRLVRGSFGFLFSKRAIPTWKGALAYVLAYVFIFLRGFDERFDYPATMTGITLLTIAGFPGKTMGACIQAVMLGLLGVGVGCVDFVILAELGQIPVAQAIVFAIMIYILALIKASSLRYLGFSLLAMLMTFNGIYTSLINNGEFIPGYLESYIEAYVWGSAIVLFVNICVFPRSSESELRKLLVVSLDHVRTFMHLVNKGYLETLTEDERAVRAQLVQSLRADFGFLNQMIGETSIEVNWSRWSMKDYRQMVLKMRSLQAILIAAYSGLLNGEENGSVDTFKRRFLPSSVQDFKRLRRDICATLGEIIQELATEPLDLDRPGYAEFMDCKKEDPPTMRPASVDGDVEHGPDFDELARRLREEARDPETNSNLVSDTEKTAVNGSTSGQRSPSTAVTPGDTTLVSRNLIPGDRDDTRMKEPDRSSAVKHLRSDFDAFSAVQLDLIADLLVSGSLSNGNRRLSIYAPSASIADTFGPDHVRGLHETKPVTFHVVPSRHAGLSSLAEDQEKDYDETDSDDETAEDRNALEIGQGLVRVYSLLFAMNRFVIELQQLHTHVTQHKGAERHKRLHIHVWESIARPHFKSKEEGATEAEMCMKQAVATLEAKTYTPIKINLWQRLLFAEQWLRTPTSVYAFKVTAALCVFGVLIWAPAVRPWFQSYGLTGALITIVIALTPTLGQSLLTFVMQILGSGIGYISGLVMLEIFKGVGGYVFNPFGITCLMGLFALPLSYLVYEKPMYFTLALLAMNSAGVLIATEHVYLQYEGIPTFDSPPYRAGKALAALSIALLLVALFQLLILRNPARRTLREALAHLLSSQLSYVTILQAYMRATMPTDPKDAPSQAILLRVERELKHREQKLQAEIISLNPLISFAAAEPQWTTAFHGDAAQKILRSSQILLDRWSEARSALGTDPFQPFILKEFVAVLSPYRRQSTMMQKTSLYLAAASLASKLPLPREVPKTGRSILNLVQDALMISSKLAKTEEGIQSVKSGEFARYWFYILVVTSACKQIEVIDGACREMYGSFEDQVI